MRQDFFLAGVRVEWEESGVVVVLRPPIFPTLCGRWNFPLAPEALKLCKEQNDLRSVGDAKFDGIGISLRELATRAGIGSEE